MKPHPNELEETDVKCDWKIISASVIGKAHLQSNTECQDSHSIYKLRTGDVVIAVADGAGSASCSQMGSKLAVTKVVSHLSTLLGSDYIWEPSRLKKIIRKAFKLTRQDIYSLAKLENKNVRVFSTTLTCLLLSVNGWIIGQIGDGTVIVLKGNGKLITGITPQRGEYVNETYFITMKYAMRYLKISSHKGKNMGAGVLTDGLLHLATFTRNSEPANGFFLPIFQFVSKVGNSHLGNEELKKFLESEKVNSKTSDDKTLVIAVLIESNNTIS